MDGFAPFGVLPYGVVPPYVAPVQGPSQPYLLLSPADSDAAVLTSGTAVGSLPIGNVQTIQPKKAWRSTTPSDFIAITLAEPLPANALALVGHNLSSAALVRVRGALIAANVTSAPDIDTGWQSPWPATGKPRLKSWPNRLCLVRWNAALSCQNWRIDIADPSLERTFIEIGRLAFGVAWQPTINFDLGGTPYGFSPTDVQTTTPWGYTFTDRRGASAARTMALTVTAGDRREVLDGIAEIQRLAGMAADCIICLDPAETTDFHRYSMQGVFTAKPVFPIVQQFTTNGVMYGASIQATELL